MKSKVVLSFGLKEFLQNFPNKPRILVYRVFSMSSMYITGNTILLATISIKFNYLGSNSNEREPVK